MSLSPLVVPQQVLTRLLTALHIQLGHPSSRRLKAVTKRYLYALDLDKAIDHITQACQHCASLRPTPTARVEQSSCPHQKLSVHHLPLTSSSAVANSYSGSVSVPILSQTSWKTNVTTLYTMLLFACEFKCAP